ncbi:MAG: hypothetical protein IJ899_15690, partial [Blautia sp.]|nr:hypothetical protein [Blautia sp.]
KRTISLKKNWIHFDGFCMKNNKQFGDGVPEEKTQCFRGFQPRYTSYLKEEKLMGRPPPTTTRATNTTKEQ